MVASLLKQGKADRKTRRRPAPQQRPLVRGSGLRVLPLGVRPPSLRVRRARKKLGQTIRTLREKEGLTLEDLALLCRRTPMKIAGLERGQREVYLSTMVRLADALGVRLDRLLKGIK